MFLVKGRLSAVKDLADGRFAYSRGPKKPAAILTLDQLEEVQRLNSVRLILPYCFLVLGSVIIFILNKDQMPLTASVAVGATVAAISAYVVITMTMRIGKILGGAASQADLPDRIPLAAFFGSPLRSSSDLRVRMGKWFWGCTCIASIAVPVIKYPKSDNIDRTDILAMFGFAIFSYVLFRAFSVERRRRKTGATDKD
ncbi:hypothetical protein [Mesorhizobium caraganae]|uniref:hypothetical protein n=1 Tax=Mesorhizobium caraganae TaxID=483206 RepID=UPI001786B514|nr:hypothetical protein [Mesorhizobium caraganae]